jgi:hypothetical protein
MERVLSDIRRDTEEARLNHLNPSPVAAPSSTSSNPTLSKPSNSMSAASVSASSKSSSTPEIQRKVAKANRAANALGKGKAVTGAGARAVNGVVNGAGTGEGTTGLAVPQTVIEEGVRITRECLEQVCEVDE